MDQSLVTIETRAQALRAQGETEQKSLGRRANPGQLWLEGEYTRHNREHN
jgi:hypothetical protein